MNPDQERRLKEAQDRQKKSEEAFEAKLHLSWFQRLTRRYEGRPLGFWEYFLLAGIVEKFHYLKHGLGVVLGFIGVKMLLPLISKVLSAGFHAAGMESLAAQAHEATDIPIGIALGIVVLVLLASVGASLLWPPKAKKH